MDLAIILYSVLNYYACNLGWICYWKRIFKIKKIRYKDNGNVTILNMFLREIVGYNIISLVTFGLSVVVSILMVMFRKDKRAIHDFIGRTYVNNEYILSSIIGGKR